jgi:PAS domain S-box-containing protein
VRGAHLRIFNPPRFLFPVRPIREGWPLEMNAPDAAETFRVLIVEDDPAYLFLLNDMVQDAPASRFRVVAKVSRLEQGIEFMVRGAVDVVLLDLTLPDCRGLETFTRAHAAAPHVPIIVLSGHDDEELALQTVHLGAQEYLVKGRLDAHLLHRALRYAIERARAEAALAQERDLLSTLLENIPDRIYFKDAQSRFIRINRALTSLFRLSRPDEAYGKTDADFYGSEHAQEALDDERRVMQTGEPVIGKIEKEQELYTGRTSWSLTTKLPLRDHSGRIVGTCGISREITELKAMEERLHTERNLLRSVIDNVPDLIFLKDTEGRYLLDNLAHREWMRASDPEEVIGRTVFDFFPEEMARGFDEDDRELLRSGEPLYNREETMLDSRGNARWVLTTKVPWRGEDGVIHGLLGIARDITEKKQAAEELRRANEELARHREELLVAMGRLQAAHRELREVQLQLIEAEKMKSIGRLAAGVAHEVKNPLAILKMGIDFISTLKLEDESAGMILHEMSEAVHRADTVIRGLLDFSAPKKLEVYPENLNLIIDGALKFIRGELKGTCEIVRELQRDLPRIPIDGAKLLQVFINLFTNAMHAMEDGGTLTVRTYAKQLTGVGRNIAGAESESFRVGQTIVVAEIDDTGHGIPEDKLSKVFEPFFTTKPTGKGTGLGLSVVKTIIDLHGGTIDIRNRPEGGARVTIMLQA